MRSVSIALVAAVLGSAVAFTPPTPASNGSNKKIAASSLQAPPTHQLSSWKSNIQDIANRLDDIVWGE